MKRLKKTLAVVLTLCMMLSCVSVTAFATEAEQSAAEITEEATEEANTLDDDANKEVVVSNDSEEENTEVTLEDKWLHPQNSGISTTSATDDFFKIMFLDCGRKYFSVDSIKQIIDNASAAGFNYRLVLFPHAMQMTACFGFRLLQ